MEARAFSQDRTTSTAGAEIDLNGSWQLREVGERAWRPAVVPGSVQSDLLRQGQLADPYYRDSELQAQWVGEKDWEYRRRFTVQREILEHDALILECLGLDTIAEIYVNGTLLAKTANMFREYELDVKTLLQAGENELRVLFRSPLAWCRQVDQADPRVIWGDLKSKARKGFSSFLRKEACDFGWDWGIRLVRSGIWRPIRIAAYSTARLTRLGAYQIWERNEVHLELASELVSYRDEPLTLEASVHLEDRELFRTALPAAGGLVSVPVEIQDPQLWWPNELGSQPLYTVRVELHEASGVCHQREVRTGLRQVELVREKDSRGESFGFRVNGQLVFCKGANWVPADALPEQLTVQQYRKLLLSCRDAHMNMLRLWGGGRYEADVFYDQCDELGIMIWHDFMFAEGPYVTTPEYLDNIREEIRTQVCRLGHHPSIVLWCGNNESESNMTRGHNWLRYETVSWEEYDRIFEETIPSTLAKFDRGRPYWPSSPHHPLDRKGTTEGWDTASGDTHIWEVWHDLQPPSFYERQRGYRFVSEFGFQSLPVMETIRAFTEAEDRHLTSPIMEHHQRADKGSSKLAYYLASMHRMPSSFEDWIYLTQVLHAEIVKIGVETFRRNYPHTAGALYWQLNNNWPAPSGCSIDYFGRWNALHYLACRFFHPILVCVHLDGVQAEVWGVNDLRQDMELLLRWSLRRLDGEPARSGQKRVVLPACSSTPLEYMSFEEDLADDLRQRTDRHESFTQRANHYLFVALMQGATQISSNIAFFVPPKFLNLPDPQLVIDAYGSESAPGLIVATKQLAVFVEIGLSRGYARFSDNYFHLLPGEQKHVGLLESDIQESEIPDRLCVKSLFDARRGSR